MKIKLNTHRGIILLMAGFLFFPYIFKDVFMPQIVASLNFVSLIGIYCISKKIKILKIKIGFFQITLIVLSIVFLIFNGNSAGNVIKTIFSIYFPLALLFFLGYDSVKTNEDIFETALKIYKIIIIALFVLSVIDHFTSNYISSFFYNLYKGKQYSDDRFYSFYGHPLTTMIIAFAYLILAITDKLYINTSREIISDLIMCSVIILNTGSKTGLFAVAIVGIIFLTSKKTYKYSILIIGLIFVLEYFGAFDLVLERLFKSYEKNDITTGRISHFMELYNEGSLKFSFLNGNIIPKNDSRYSAYIAALENPILRWAYRYGILYSFLMTLVTIVYPCIRIIKNAPVKTWLLFLTFVAVINTCDTICSIGEYMIFYCAVVFLLTLSYRIYNDEKIQNKIKV